MCRDSPETYGRVKTQEVWHEMGIYSQMELGARLPRITHFVPAIALVLAACTGFGRPATESQPVSKVAFVRAADQACASAEARLATLWEPGWRAGLAKKAVYWRGALPIYRDLLAGLRSLTPPESDRASVQNLWDQLEVVVDRFSLALRSAEVGDEGGYMMFEIGGFERLMDVRWDATKYGLRVCGLKQQR
jgi:hypothetical protein